MKAHWLSIPALAIIAASHPLTPSSVSAQTEEQKAAMVEALGETIGEGVASVHFAVNSLAENWQNKVYDKPQAVELAGSYKGTAAHMLTLAKDASPAIKQGLESLVKQATILETWIQTEENSLADTYQKVKAETDGLLFPGTGTPPAMISNENTPPDDAMPTPATVPQPEPEASAPGIELAITKSIGPKQQAGPSGTFKVTRLGPNMPVRTVWEYENGSRDSGLGLPFPGTGKLAAFYGQGVQSLHLYRLTGKQVEGVWVGPSTGNQIRRIAMTQGDNGNEFLIEGGAGDKFTMSVQAGGIANVTWHLQDGKTPGIAVIDGDFLAAIAVDPQQTSGLALYTLADDLKTATSRWTFMGAGGVGTEELTVTKIDERFFQAPAEAAGTQAAPPPTPSDTAMPSGGDSSRSPETEAEIKAIAEEIREDLGKLAAYQPTAEQVAAIISTTVGGQRLFAYAEAQYAQIPSGQGAAKPGQSEVIVLGPDWRELPGGYTNKKDHFKDGVEIYGFKYVKPGESSGMAYDALFKVDGQWIFIPKAWRVFDARP